MKLDGGLNHFVIYHPYYGEMIQFDERAYFSDGWEKKHQPGKSSPISWGPLRVFPHLETATGPDRSPDPWGTPWEYESSAIKSSLWFWNPRYFQGNVVF